MDESGGRHIEHDRVNICEKLLPHNERDGKTCGERKTRRLLGFSDVINGHE